MSPSNCPVGALVLAAGQSRRFGADKRFQLLQGSTNVLEQSVRNAAAAFEDVLVVLRADETELAQELKYKLKLPDLKFCLAQDAELGMAHSLAAGIKSVGHWQGAAVLLGDMPFLRGETLKTLVQRFTDIYDQDPILIPTFEGQNGHPVLFSSAYFKEIVQLTGDIGARPVVQAHGDKVVQVEVDDPGVIRDIDRPEDLA